MIGGLAIVVTSIALFVANVPLVNIFIAVLIPALALVNLRAMGQGKVRLASTKQL